MKLELLVISPPGFYAGESILVSAMFAHGLKKYHVRKPGWTAARMKKLLEEFPARWRKRIIIHSHYALAGKLTLGGIHLTEKSRVKKISAAYNPKHHSLSASTHSLLAAARESKRCDYVFLSPVFNSISKKGYKAAFKSGELKELLKRNSNIIALGGTTPATLKKIKRAGFNGAAALGYIWESKDPVKAFLKLRSKIE